MTTEELKNKIRKDENGIRALEALLQQDYFYPNNDEDILAENPRPYLSRLIGEDVKFLESKRINNNNWWRFQIGDKTYETNGYYSSYEGAELDNPMNFYEVKQVEKTITVWEKV